MPISHTIDPRNQMVWVAFFGTVTAGEMLRYFAEVETNSLYDPSFARVIDWRDLSSPPASADVAQLVQMILASATRGSAPGRRALIVRQGLQYGVGRMLQTSLEVNECRAEFELFSGVSEAEAWARGARPEVSAA
jgi:hypothetical protein